MACPGWIWQCGLDSEDKRKRAEAVRQRLQGAPARRRARGHARLARAIVWGALAAALAIAWLADAYGVETGDLLNALMASFGFVVVFSALALFGAAVLGGLRLLLQRRRRRIHSDSS